MAFVRAWISVVDSVPAHSFMRNLFQVSPFKVPAVFAALYLALHSFAVRAALGAALTTVKIANVLRAADESQMRADILESSSKNTPLPYPFEWLHLVKGAIHSGMT